MHSHIISCCPTIAGLLFLVMTLSCCKKKAAEPASDKLKKVWTAQSVRENNAVVYTRGSSNNIRNYTAYKLDLSSAPAVSLTDWDGLTFVGQYELSGSTRLVLENLSPQPTGTNGTIEFTINSVSENQLDLTRVTASPKTGGSTNQYILTNP